MPKWVKSILKYGGNYIWLSRRREEAGVRKCSKMCKNHKYALVKIVYTYLSNREEDVAKKSRNSINVIHRSPLSRRSGRAGNKACLSSGLIQSFFYLTKIDLGSWSPPVARFGILPFKIKIPRSQPATQTLHCRPWLQWGAFHSWCPQDFLTYWPLPPALVRNFTQPPLLKSMTSSNFPGPPPPSSSADVINRNSLIRDLFRPSVAGSHLNKATGFQWIQE